VRPVGIAAIASDLSRHRQLLLSLTWRDIRVRYKQSVLGIAWAALLPLSMMLIFAFVFTRAIKASSVLASDTGMPYPLFAFAGLVPWTFFAVSLNGSVNSLVANRNLVTKVYFPREVFPLSCVGSAFVDFCIALVVLVGLGTYYHFWGGYEITLRASALFIPVVIAVQIILTIGLGMLLAMGNLFYRDVRQIFTVGIQLWMFVSAVVVPVPRDGSVLASVIALNPMVPLMGAYRDCLIHGQLPEFTGFCYVAAVAVGVLVGGWSCFRRASYRFAECI
jgi:ABC-type polysaccharide/polyol phosphate export permease